MKMKKKKKRKKKRNNKKNKKNKNISIGTESDVTRVCQLHLGKEMLELAGNSTRAQPALAVVVIVLHPDGGWKVVFASRCPTRTRAL